MENKIRKITGLAPLEYQVNPAFTSFKCLSFQSANAAVKKLTAAGYSASRVDNYVKIMN